MAGRSALECKESSAERSETRKYIYAYIYKYITGVVCIVGSYSVNHGGRRWSHKEAGTEGYTELQPG